MTGRLIGGLFGFRVYTCGLFALHVVAHGLGDVLLESSYALLVHGRPLGSLAQ